MVQFLFQLHCPVTVKSCCPIFELLLKFYFVPRLLLISIFLWFIFRIANLPTTFVFLQKEFLDKYESFAQLVAKIYPSENVPSVSEMRDLLASM